MEFFRGTKPRILKHNKKIIKEETAAYTLTLEEQNLNKCSQDLNYVMCECFPGHVSVICQICSEICHKGHPIKMKLKNSLLMSNYLKCLCGGTIHKSTGIMTEPSFKIMKNIDKCMENHINEEEDEMDGEDCSIQEDSENEGYKTVRLISRLLENSKEFRELKPERKNKEKLKYLNKLETFYYTIYPKNEYYNNLPGVFKSNDIADYSKIDMKSIENEDYLSIAKELTFYLSNEELNSKKKLNIFSFYHLNTVKNLFAKYNEVLKCLYKKSVQEKNSIFEFLKGASNKDLMKFQSESNLISLNIESKKNTKQIKLFNNDFLDLIFNIIDKESTFHEFDEKYLSGITYNFIIFVILSINKNLNHYNLLKINHVVKSSKEYYNQLSKSVKKVISFRDEEDNYNDSDSINELNKKHENIKDANTSDYEDNPDSDKTGIEGNFTSYIFCNRVITMFNVFHKVVIRKYISCVNELDFQSYLNLNIATRKIYFHDLVNILDSFNKDNTNALCYDFREMYFKTLVDILKIMIINSQKDLMIQAYLHINIKAISIIFLDASKFNLANLDILESYFKLIDKYFNVFTIKQDEMLSFYNIISETIFYYLMFKVDKRIIDHISCVYVESNENKINKVEDLFNDYDKILRTDQSFKINDKEDDENEYLNTNSDRDLNTTKDTLHTTTNKTNFKYPFELDESSISLIMTISKLFLEVQKHSSCQKRNVYGRFIHNTSKFALKTQLFTYNPDLNSNLKKSCRKNSISDIEHNLDDIKAISLLGYLNIELISGSFDNNYNSLRNILESNGVTEILNAKQYLDLRLPIFKNSLDYNDQVVIDYSSISSDNDMIHYFIKIIKENETNTYSNNNFSSKMKEWIDNFNSKINQIFNNNNESNKEPFLLKAKESFFLNSNNIIDIERLKNFQNQVIFSKFITYLDKFILIYLSNNLSFLDEVEAKDTEAFYDEIRLKNKNSNRKLTRTMSQKLNTKKIKFKSHLCFNDSQIKNNLMNKLLNIILGISYFNTQVISLILSLQYQSFARLFSKANQGYFNFLNNFSVFFSYNMNKKSITNYTYYNFSFLIEQIIMTNNNNDTVVSLTKTMSLEENDEDIEYSKLILLENKSKKFSTLPLENMIKLSDSNSDRNQIEEMISECFNDSTQQENYFKSITFILNISSCLLNYKDLHLRSLNKLILHVKSLLDKIISNKNLVKALEACLLFPQILREDLIINQFFISYFKFLNTLKSNNNESFIGIIDVNNLIIRRFILLNLNISPKVLDRDEKNEGLIQENIYYYNKELFFLIQEYIFNHLVFFDSSVAGNKLILKNLYKLKFPKQELNEVLNKKKMNLKWNFMGSVTNGNTFYGEYSQKNLLTGKRLNLIDDDIKKELDEALKRKEGDDNEYEEINYRLVDLDLNYIINTDTHDSNGTGRDYFLETIQIYSKSFDDLIERVLYVSEFAIKNIIYDLNNNDSDDISFYNINQCHSRFSKLILTPFFRLIQNLNIKMNYFIKNQEEICKSRIIVCVLINKLYEYTLLFYEAENRFRESICESKKSDYLNTNINEYLITKSIDNLDLLKSIIYEHEDLFKKSIVISDESTRTSLNEYFNNNEDCVFEKLDLLKYINTVIANKTDVFNLKNSKNVFNEDYSINNEVSDEEVVDLFIKTNPNLKLRLNNYNIISCATHRPVNFRNLGGSDKNEINTNINLSSEKVKQFSCIEEAFDSILSPFNSLINFDDNNSDTDEENINTSMRITDINEDVFKKILGKFSETLNIILRKKIIHNINGSIDHFKHLTTINETINTIEKEKYQVLNTYCKVSNSIKYGNLYNTSINYLFASNIPLAKKTFLHIFYQLKFDPLSNNKLFCKDPSFSELSNDFILKIKYINNLFKYDKKLSKDIIEEIFIDDNNEILNNYFTGLMKAIIIYYYCAFDTFNYTYSVDILNVINTNNNSFLEKLKHIANEDKENINVRYEMNNVFEIELFGLSYSEVLKEFLQNMFLSNKIVKIFLEMNFLNIVADYTEENMMRELDLNKEHKISSVLTNSEYVDYNNTIASNTINYENSLVNNNENLNSNQKVLFKMVNEISKDNMNEINDDMKKTINDFLQIILKKDNEKNTDNKANIEGKEDNSLVNFNFSFFNYIYLLVDFSVLFTTKEMFDFTYKEKILKNTTNSILTLNLKDNIYIRSKSKSDHTDVSLYSYILDNLNNLTQLKHSDSSNYITSFISYDYQDYYIRNNFVYLLSFCFENSDKVFQPFNKMLIYYLYKSIKMLNFMLKMNLFNEAGISKLVDQKVFNLPEKIKFLINVVVEKYRYNLEYKDSSLLEKVKENDKSNPKSNGIEEFVRLYFNFKRIISNENKLSKCFIYKPLLIIFPYYYYFYYF